MRCNAPYKASGGVCFNRSVLQSVYVASLVITLLVTC